MHSHLLAITLRNIFFFALFMIVVMNPNAHLVQQELFRIWKTINTPLLPKKPAGTNHKSNRFWEIDMTKLEP
jgi:hypothetical protein